MKWTGRRFLVVAALGMPAVTLAACGGNVLSSTAPSVPTPVPPPPSPTILGPADPALVGAWTGNIDGSVGASSYTMSLNADASMSAEGTGNYCRMVGNWGVSGGQFTARGTECLGFVVTFVAPASIARLSGTWVASGGARGQFDIAR